MITFFVLISLSTAIGANIKVKIEQPDGLKYITVGEEISLTCTFSSDVALTTAWVRQTPGQKPLKIASAYYNTEVQYDTGLQNTGRFRALKTGKSFTLNISNAEPSDSATYYCAVTYYIDVDLDSCIIIVHKGLHASHYALTHQPVLDPVMLGDNITLRCTVLTRGCAGEHSVYWFKHESGESYPGIIYTQGSRSDQCNKNSETDSPTQSCVYKLPKRNLRTSDAGTYYCAVAMCGEILFGKGTQVVIEDNVQSKLFVILSIMRSAVLLLVFIMFLLYTHCAHQ